MAESERAVASMAAPAVDSMLKPLDPIVSQLEELLALQKELATAVETSDASQRELADAVQQSLGPLMERLPEYSSKLQFIRWGACSCVLPYVVLL